MVPVEKHLYSQQQDTKTIKMEINKMTFKTNIDSDVAADEVKSAFKADKRIWSFDFEKNSPGNLLHVAGELESAEIEAKIRSIGFEAMIVD